MIIRPATKADASEWLRMRKALWPTCSDEMHAREINEYTSSQERAVFVLDRSNGKLGGFVEISIRPRVDGASSPHVAYLEGLYVDPDLRRRGFGRELVAAAERWAATKGMTELASDAETKNPEAIALHKALGFRETFRLVHFLKSLR